MVNKPLKLPGVGQYIRLEVDQEVMEVTSSYRSISVLILHLNIFMERNLFLLSSTWSPTFFMSQLFPPQLEESWLMVFDLQVFFLKHLNAIGTFLLIIYSTLYDCCNRQ